MCIARLSSVATILTFAIGLPAVSLPAKTIDVPRQQKTIQAAIDAATPGDAVLVAPGVYREYVRMKPGVTLRSAGDDKPGNTGLARAETTVIEGAANADGPGVTMAEGAALDGFTIRNVGRYDDAEWQKHFDTRGDNQPHEHIGGFSTPGVGIDGVTCTVTRCIVHHNGSTGIAIRGGEGKACSPRVAGNVCYRNMGGGIGSMAGSTAWIEANRCYENFYAGIGHEGASPMVVGNECFGNVRAGIGVSEGACPVVRGNKCHGNRRAGIGVRTGENTSPVVENNDCYENEMAGIGVEDHATPIVRGNRCYRNKLAGIGSQEGARPLLVRNECFENLAAGIGTREGARTLMVENHIHHNEQAGIGIEDDAAAVLIGNRCIENKLVALGVPKGGSAVAVDNELRRTGGMPPLAAAFAGAKLALVNNRLIGGGVATLLVEGDAVLAGNQLSGDGERPGHAIWARPGTKLRLIGNRFEGYATALRAACDELIAAANEISGIRDAAFTIDAASSPAYIVGNRATSKNPAAKIVSAKGQSVTEIGNAIKAD
jgi:parallel beta-helix repeat protein